MSSSILIEMTGVLSDVKQVTRALDNSEICRTSTGQA